MRSHAGVQTWDIQTTFLRLLRLSDPADSVTLSHRLMNRLEFLIPLQAFWEISF